MKNVFNINLTKNVDNDTIDGCMFISRKTSEKSSDLLDMKCKDFIKFFGINELMSKTFNILNNTLRFICVCSFALALNDVIKGHEDNIKIFSIVFPILIILSLLLFIYEVKQVKSILMDPDFQKELSKTGVTLKPAKHNLEVPQNAKEIDILRFQYIIENGLLKNLINQNDYEIVTAYIYLKDNYLCFADSNCEISIPLFSVVEINNVDKKAYITQWDKHNINTSYYSYNSGDIDIIETYYQIVINSNFGEFKILVPDYDINSVFELTKDILNVK